MRSGPPLLRCLNSRRTLLVLALTVCTFNHHTFADTQLPDLAIIGAEIFDGTGTPPYRGAVVINQGVIVNIVPRGNTLPATKQTIDAEGLALLPGFFDLHVHFTPRGEPATAPQILSAYAAAGVTTVFNFHAAPEAFEPLASWYRSLPGPNVRFVARMSTTGGHGADWADANMTRRVNSAPAAQHAVQDLTSTYQPDAIKAFADGWRYGSGIDNSSMDEPTLTALVAAAHAEDTPVLTHTVTAERLAIAGRAGVDVIAHSTLDRRLKPDEIKALRDGGGAYAGTLAVYDPDKPRSNLPPIYLDMLKARFAIGLQNMKALHNGGVPIALGTDAGMPGTPHGQSTHREMVLMQQAGLTPTQVLVAATANSARAVGEYQSRGSIAVGKQADLLLIDGAPWKDIQQIHNVRRTMVGGVTVFDATTESIEVPTHPAPTKLADATIEDFERTDGRTTRNAVIVGDFDMGKERSTQVFGVRPSDERSGNVLTLTGELAVKDNPYVGVIVPLSRGSAQPYDVTNWQGLRFAARGDPGAITVHFYSVAGVSEQTHKLDAQWRTLDIPFSALTENSTTSPLGGLTSIGIRIQRPGGQKTWLELDDVVLY